MMALSEVTLPFEPKAMPAVAGKRVLLATGTHDPYVPETDSDRLAELLEAGGAEVTYLKSGRSHDLAPEELKAVGEWLTRWR